MSANPTPRAVRASFIRVKIPVVCVFVSPHMARLPAGALGFAMGGTMPEKKIVRRPGEISTACAIREPAVVIRITPFSTFVDVAAGAGGVVAVAAERTVFTWSAVTGAALLKTPRR